MLLKWLFTLLAILWLIQAIRPYFRSSMDSGFRQPPGPPPPDIQNKPVVHDDGEYIDYEEIK